MTSATDELRRMLDERGVEWGNIRRDGSESDYLTEWQFENNQGRAIAIEWAVGSGLSIEIHRYHLTPEQAIAAALGDADATAVRQGVAGTCHPVISDNLTESEGTGDAWADCSECGHLLFVLTDPNSQVPNFCPNCGRRIEQ